MAAEDLVHLLSLLSADAVAGGGLKSAGILQRVLGALLTSPSACSQVQYEKTLAPVIMDILEVVKTSPLNSDQQLSYLILTSYAVNFGSIRHLFDISQHLPKDLIISNNVNGGTSTKLSGEYIRALRYLYRSKKLRNYNKLNMGPLVSLAFTSKEDDEGVNTEYFAKRYQALRLLCEALQLPYSYTLTLLMKSFQSDTLAQMIWADIGNDNISYISDVITVCGEGDVPVLPSDCIKFKHYGTPTVNIVGITLPTSRTELSWSSGNIVPTPTSLRNLRQLAQAISIQVPIIIEGESGCGKSFLVKELASLMGKRETLLELHLDDQTDSKALIGSYVCSDVPGEFIWQPGLVTQAAVSGTWLLIEDIDKASLEVIATLTPILESGRIPNGVGEDITVHPAFRVFGSRTVGADHATTGGGGGDSLTPKHLPNFRHFSYSWHIITFEMNSIEEVEEILKNIYPHMLPFLRNSLLNTYTSFRKQMKRDGSMSGKIVGLRSFSLRDLLKTAERFGRSSTSTLSDVNKKGKKLTGEQLQHSGYVTEQHRLDCVADIVDVFLGSIRKKNELYRNLVLEIGRGEERSEGWGLSEEVLDAHIFQRNPDVSINNEIVRIGRAEFSLPDTVNGSLDNVKGYQQQFAFTKYALRLLETIAVCVSQNEPVLLVGETGTGKTTSVQELATMLKQTLVVQNISLSTDSSDLLGGFRPVSLRQLFQPTYERFVSLFRATFSQTQNSEYLYVVAQYFRKEQWKKLLKAFQKAGSNALKKIKDAKTETLITIDDEQLSSRVAWVTFVDIVQRLVCNLPKITHGFAFAFVNGLLVEAMRKGQWVLLDEINLASPETLQGLVGILDGQSLCLTEKGDIKPIFRHPNFRIFAAMNPPTDVGKRELPETLRGRFTEIYVEEMEDKQDLQVVVQRYLEHLSNGVSSASAISDIVDIYLGCRATAEETLVDGGGQKPHYSLRSLTRALKACNSFMEVGFRPLSRALYEGFLLSFQTQLSPTSRLFMSSFLLQCLSIKGGKSMMLPPPRPGGRQSSGEEWVLVKPYWLRRGPMPLVDWAEPDKKGITRFVMTDTVEKNIRDIARAVSADITAVLLQGPTSVGKTSMIEFLAAKCGYRCIRINNHEHTDVQEYVGGYITGSDGRLVFKDGVLVEALRRGDWIILDELNLAPSDVLEALNRLLDDNKELFIPETGEFVKPAPGFFLFATQNPAGAYGGRKPLSRAFRNRFIEISICDLPFAEVESIVSLSCGIPAKYSKCLVGVMREMQMHRQQSSILQGKYGSITTRDLIKWGKRKPQSPVDIVREGFMILAEKHRGEKEKEEILEILLQICKVGDFDTSSIYEIATEEEDDVVPKETNCTFNALRALRKFQIKLRDNEVNVEGVGGIAITYSVRRLWTLVSRCMDNSEPVLLIGETGTGKTTVCQLVAAERNQRIRIVNCHQSTETADIIGGLRPVRGRAGLLKELHGYVRRIMAVHGHSLPVVETLMTALDQNEEDDTPAAVDESLLSSAMSELSLHVSQSIASDSSTEVESIHTQGNKKIKISHEDENGESSSCDVITDLSLMVKATLELWRRYMSLFEWQDGPLVEAMKCGDVFILDEINLAEDAVIERLNSVLENSRTLTLAERGSQSEDGDDDSNVVVVAHPNFRFLATMNPGDDYGKRELSPALRSRFSEMWVPNVTDSEDIVLIISEMMNISAPGVDALDIAHMMVSFMSWMNDISAAKTMVSIKMSIREVLAWARFICNWDCSNVLDAYIAFVHGAQMLVLDGLGIGTSISQELITDLKTLGISKLIDLCPPDSRDAVFRTVIPASLLNSKTNNSVMPKVVIDAEKLSVGFFHLPLGPVPPVVPGSQYILNANSTVVNFQRVLRAMKLPRPILLEGPPGVGKTSLISNLAALTGHKLVRINLSEHSELSDLIGTDLPSSNSSGESSSSKFNWCDGVFLTALKNGDWILLDELNLAPQSVLEGLNACFDHRGEVFIPEIGKSFYCPPSFRVFCAQNPMSEGGGRKGLPQSFLTRFSRVFVEAMDGEDMVQICVQAYEHKLPRACLDHIQSMVKFVQILQYEISCNKSFARSGSPWEFNLRDTFRWCDLLTSRLSTCRALESTELTTAYLLADAAHVLFVSRLRNQEDRKKICEIFLSVFGFALDVDLRPQTIFSQYANSYKVMIGCEVLEMSSYMKLDSRVGDSYFYGHPLEQSLRGPLLKTLESVAACIRRQWPLLLVGATGSGKRRVIRHLAHITGNMTNLVEFSATPTTDATELLGSFEQASIYRHLNKGVMLLNRICSTLLHTSIVLTAHSSEKVCQAIINTLSLYYSVSEDIENITTNNSLMLHNDKQIELSKGTSIFHQLEHLLTQLKLALGACYSAQQVFADGEGIDLPLLPESESLAIVEEAHTIFQFCQSSCNQVESSGNFEWVDGIVVRALEQGLWLLIDNVNLCSSSVLDRLNSLLEPNGYLLLTESGVGRIVRPHKNFRIFFTMDNTYGEISRAMRNRCVELAVIDGLDDRHEPKTVAKGVNAGIDGDIALLTVQASSASVMSESVWDQLTTLYRVLAGHPTCPTHRLFHRTLQVFELEMAAHVRTSPEVALQAAISCVVPFAAKEYYLHRKLCEAAAVGVRDAVEDAASVSLSVPPSVSCHALHALQNIAPYLSSHTFFVLYMIWIVESREHFSFSKNGNWLSYLMASGCPSNSSVMNEIEKILTQHHLEESEKVLSGSATAERISQRGIVSTATLRPYVYARLRRCYASLASPIEKHCMDTFLSQNAQLFTCNGIFTSTSTSAEPQHLLGNLFSSAGASTHDILCKYIDKLGCGHLVGASHLQLFQRGHERLQSRLGTFGLLNQHYQSLGVDISSRGIVVLMKLFESFIAMEEQIFGHRYHIVWLEEQSTCRANNRVFSEAVSSYLDYQEGSLSLFSVAVIAASNEELNDCKEGQVLSSMHTLLTMIHNLYKPLYTHVLEMCATQADDKNEGSQSQVATAMLLEAFVHVLSCRDKLSMVLMEASANISDMPWGHLEVCLRWIRKTCLAFSSIVHTSGAAAASCECHKQLEAACLSMEDSLEAACLSVCTYWKTSFQFQKLRLWKDGGHAAMPVKETDWVTRKSIRNTLLAAAGIVKLPGFVDLSLSRVDSSFSTQHMDLEKMNSYGNNEDILANYAANMSHKIRRNTAIMKEWLCLYSTFYWSCSNEIPEDFMNQTKSITNIDFTNLIISLGNQFETSLQNIPSEIQIRNNLVTSEEVVRTSSWSEVIDDEIKSAGWLFSVIAAEPITAKLMSEVSNTVGELCFIFFQSAIVSKHSSLNDGEPSFITHSALNDECISLMQSLHRKTASLLAVALQCTLFDMTLLRELQTLVWFLDAVLLVESGDYKCSLSLSANEKDVFHKLLTTFSVMIDVRLYSIVTSNLSNSLKSVQFRWGSELLTRLVGRSSLYGMIEDADEIEVDDEELTVGQLHPSQVANTGAIRLLTQAVPLELVLHMLDASGLSLPLATHPDLRSFVMHDVPVLTLSSCKETRSKLLELFRLNVTTGVMSKSQRVAATRLDLLKYFTFSTIFSCRDYLDADKFESIFLGVKTACAGSSTTSLFNALAAMQLDVDCTKNSFLSSLFSKCLKPLLNILLWTEEHIDSGPEVDVSERRLSQWMTELSKAWVYLGLLRVNLLVPQSPVDPSVKPAIKVDLLSRNNERLEQTYVSHEMELSLTGASRKTPQMISFERQHVANANKVHVLGKKIIYRPAEVPLFTDLYHELREVSESLLQVDRVLHMLATASSLGESISATLWTNAASVAQAKEYMTRLTALSREELSWQESLSGFVSRVLNVYHEYEDVVSPIISAINNISQGVRAVVSASVSGSEECLVLQSGAGSAGIRQCAVHVFRVPSMANLNLSVSTAGVGVASGSVAPLKSAILTSVENFEKYAEPLISRGSARLAAASEADNTIPFSTLTASHTTTCVRFLALSRIEYLLGCNVVDSHCLDLICAEYISRFVRSYQSNSEARKARAMRKQSLYQYKENDSEKKPSSEAVFTSNDELEELQDLNMHFPDHLGAFADIVLKGDQDLNKKSESDLLDIEMADAGANRASISSEEENVEVEGKLIEEDDTISSLVGFHMRKIFVHCYLKRQMSGDNWIKSVQCIHSDASVQKIIFQDLRTSLQMSMFKNLLMTGKMMQWGLGQVNDEGMGAGTRGFSLLVLHALSTESSRGTKDNLSLATDASMSGNLSYRWIEKLANTFETLQRPIDRDLLLLLENKCVSDWNPLNFQIDPNPGEITKASDPVRKILQSTMDILAMFPGNEILVVICQICARILQFPITVPIGKMLASVEFLLVRMQEWEQYAAKHVSLKDDMQALVVLISDWRKLELKSWADLLRCKEVVYAARAKKMWFTLSSLLKNYPNNLTVKQEAGCGDAADGGARSSCSSWVTLENVSSKWLAAGYKASAETLEADLNGHYNSRTLNAPEQQSKTKAHADANVFVEDVYLQQVFEALDGFLRSSVVGEFPTRLHLVRLFALDLSQFSREAEEVSLHLLQCGGKLSLKNYKVVLRQKMSYICYGVWQYYEQFLGSARKFQNQLKTPIQQRLKDEIKISRWDQLNTYAVIEHSVKVHRKLNKILREYAIDVLDYPVSAIFQKEIMGNLVGDQGDLSGAVTIPSSVTIFPALSTYQITLSSTAETDAEPVQTSEVVEDSDDDDEEEDEETRAERQAERQKAKAKAAAEAMPPPPVYQEAEDVFCRVFARHQRLQLPCDLLLLVDIASLFQVPDQSNRLLQTFKLQQRMSKHVKSLLCLKDEHGGDACKSSGVGGDGLKVRFGYQAADIAEALCTDIFYRVDVLRSKEAGKSAPKNVKHRAMTELLKRLKGEGITHLRSMVPGELRRPMEIFALSPLLHEEFACDLGHAFDACSTGPGMSLSGGSVLEKAEGYYIRNVCEVNQLRVQVTAPISGDITSREATVMLGQAENMFYTLLRTRTAVSATLSDFHALCSAVDKVKQLMSSVEIETEPDSSKLSDILLDSSKYIPDQALMRDILSYRRSAGNALLCSLNELKHLLSAAAEANAPGVTSTANSECIACVSSWKIELSFKSLQDIITSVESSLSLSPSSEATSKLFSEGLGLDTINSITSPNKAYDMLDVAHLHNSSDAFAACHKSFVAVSEHLNALLSEDVTASVNLQLVDYAAELTKQSAQLHSVGIELAGAREVSSELLDPAVSMLSAGVEKCLLAVQNLKILKSGKQTSQNFNGSFGELIESAKEKEDVDDTADSVERSLISCISLSYCSCSVLKLPSITESLQQLLELISGSKVGGTDLSVLRAIIMSALPLFECIIASVVVLIEDLLSSYKSFGKLLYVCTRMFRVLLTKGFCSDETRDGDGDGEGGDGDISKMTFEDDVEGTGMGEGEGHKDVSDQIENEEQLLGLKGDEKNEEQKSDRQLNEEEKDQGVDMMQDFDGDMCDLPDNDDKEEKEEEKQDAEREMGGELDLDNIVDEKEWGDDEDANSDTDEKQDEKETFEDSKGEGETIDGEMVTNNDEDEEKPQEQGDKKDKEEQEKEKDGGEKDKEGGEEINEDEEMLAKPLGVDVQKEENEPEENEDDKKDENGEHDDDGNAIDENNLEQPEGGAEGEDLPENMDLGGDDDEDGDCDDRDDDAMDQEEDEDYSNDKDDNADDDVEKEDDKDDSKTKMLGGEENLNEEVPEPIEEDPSDESPMDDSTNDSKEKSGSNVPAFGVQSASGQDSMMQQKQDSEEMDEEKGDGGKEGNDDEDESSKPESSSGNQSKSDDAKSGSEGMTSGNQSSNGDTDEGVQKEQKQSQRSMEPPNPFRQQGDINEKWHRRLNVQSPEDNEKSDEKQSKDKGSKATYEYDMNDEKGGDDDQDKSDMQVLAESTEQEAVQLPTPLETEEDGLEDEKEEDMNVIDEDEQVGDDKQSEKMSKCAKKRGREEADNIETTEEDDGEGAPKRPCLDNDDEEDVEDITSDHMDDDGDMADNLKEDSSASAGGEDSAFNSRGGMMVRNLDDWLAREETRNNEKLDKNETFAEDDADEASDTLSVVSESDIARIDQESLAKAREEWSLLTAMHKSDCIRLCEQLRLVLEPTLASRLQGDYRTGKRINMRRVISYVASGFRKDKIWMRRTKPSKRDYQVMMMIDDSSSMGQAGPLAMSALNVISGALSRLEVGSIGVCAFSEKLTPLHAFSSPLTDEAGANLYSQFKFQATQTRLASALQAVVPMFEEARRLASNSSNVVLQICFVISDARIDSDNREKLDKIVRELAEKNILAVLIIIDKNDDHNDSIFATKTVEFTSSGLVTRNYLDDFPFPYYVAIQQVEALPDVLSDVLKQWFELVQTQLND